MKQKIYLTDDEVSVCEVLSAFLMQDGFAVETFNGGKEVIAACEAEVPDLVVLDIMMPGMDGISTARILRGRYPRLPLFFISSKDHLREITADLGMDGIDCLRKPFSPMELIVRVKTLLEQDGNEVDQPGE